MTNKSTLAQGLSHAWPWTKPIGSSPTTSRLLRYSLLCMLVLLCGGNAWAKDVTATLTGANLMASTSPSTSYTDYTASETFTGLKDNQGNAYFGRWTYQKSGNYLNMVQIKKVESSNSSRIMLPKYSGDIKKITLNVTDANSTDFSTGNGAKTQLAIIKGTTFTANFAKNSDNQVIVKGSNSVANKTYEFDFTELETKYDGKDLYICSIDAAARIWSIEVIYSDTPSDSRVETVVELSKGYATSGEIGATLQLPTATVKAGTTVIDGASVTWESSDESVATINAEAGTISLLKKGTTTIKATYAGDDKNYLGSYVYYNVTVLGNIEDGIFDFSIGRDYGSGAVVDNSNYMTDSKTWTAGNVTMVTSGKYRWHTDNTFRIYSSDDNDNPTKLVLSVPDGNVITKIVLTGNSDISTITATSGTYANGTWTGKAQSVTLLRGTANAQIKTITVTYTSASVPEAPTFSPAAGTYYTGQYVEISCTTEGATIKKSYDGENFETYNEAFPVMEDKTIWAYAEKNGEQSEIVSASYIIGSTYDSFAPMQEAAAAEGFSNKAIQYRATGGMVVAYVNGKNAYLIDGSGNGILAYNKDGLGDLAAGQKMNYDDGYLTATLENYQGNAELTGIVFPEMTGGTVTVTPVEKKLPLTSANQSTLVTLKNLTYNADAKTLSDGTNTITFYDKFKTDVTLEDGKTYDVTGIVVMYNTTNNSTIEICPRTADDVVVAAAPAGDTYVVAGGFKDSNEQWTEGCFGTQWAPKLVDNQLVKQDNGTYSKTYENVKIAEKTTIEYKICTNGQYPDGDNKWYYFEKAGTYDITFTYDPNATEGDGITMTATLKYESVYAVGDGLGSLTDWSFADGNKLTESTETPGVYSITYNNVPASEAVFKFALDGKWDHNFGGTKDGNNAFSATIGTVYDAVYDGANISITTTETSNITLTLDLSNFDFNTKQGAKFTITSEAVEEPAGDVTATWDFRGETPTPATLTKVNVESKATYYPSNNAIAALYVNALNGKLAYNSSGYAQFNAGTILRVPVYTTDDVVTVTAFPGQYKYTIGGSAATADETVHTATAEEVSKGYVEIVATDGAYLYAITMKTTQTAAKHAVWNFLNEIPTTITGTEINLTTGNVASSVEGIALDVNGYLKARGTDGWIKTNTTMNVPVKTEGDIVTVMAYSTQYDNYTVGGKDASNNESPIYTYKATTTDATNGYVTIATSDQQAYIYAISVQQLPVKEPTTLDNEPATVTFPFNLGIEGQKATFSNEDYWLNSKVEVGGNMGYANTRTLGDVTFTKIQPQTAAASAAAEDYVLFRVQPKPGFTFTPTAVSLKAYKDGTDNGKLTIKWVADGTEYTLDTDKAIARNSETPAFSSLEYNDFTSVTPLEGYCGLKVYIGGNLGTTKQVGLSDIIIEGTLSGTEQELPILASFKVNETEYAVEDVFGDGYEATLELSKTETIVSGSNPLTEITATSGEVGNVVYADATESSCKVTIPVTAGNTTLDYVLNVVHKPDFTLTYYNVSGEEIGTQTVEKDAKIGEFAYNIANVEASKEGYKARGWFKNNYVGEKWTTESTITADAKLYAVETEIEVSSDSKKYVFDLTDKNFDANDHEAFNPTGGAWHDNQHGWVFANDDKIELLVGKKATITIGLCKYSEAGSTISAPNDENISAVVETCGSTGAIEYEGDAGTLTLTIHSTGSVYIHSIKIMNTTTTNYEVNGDWIIVKEGDASSLVDAIEAAKEGARIFLPNGTYDLGQKTLTTVGSNNVSIIGESMDGVIIKNRPTAEGISTTATLLNSSTGLYMQDLTLQNDWDYYNGGADGRAVCIQDKGTQTICKNVTLLSYQDTYYTNNANGEYYWETSNIHGTVDFICGEGTLFMEKSTLTVEKRKADGSGECTITAPSTAAGKEVGYVFNNCKIENSAASFNLGRAWNNEPRCAFINPTYNDTKLIANRWTLKGMNVVAKEFVEYNPSDGKTENNVTFTYGTTSNTMNTIISDADKFSIDKVFTGWAPNDIATQIKAPVAELKNGVITWEKVNGATAYAIFKDGEFLGITTENTWTVEEEAAPAPRRTGEEAEATTTGYTIRAANSRGGFGEPAEVSPATGINATLNDSTKDSVIYDLNGRRVMTPTKGVYIINGKKVVIK